MKSLPLVVRFLEAQDALKACLVSQHWSDAVRHSEVCVVLSPEGSSNYTNTLIDCMLTFSNIRKLSIQWNGDDDKDIPLDAVVLRDFLFKFRNILTRIELLFEDCSEHQIHELTLSGGVFEPLHNCLTLEIFKCSHMAVPNLQALTIIIRGWKNLHVFHIGKLSLGQMKPPPIAKLQNLFKSWLDQSKASNTPELTSSWGSVATDDLADAIASFSNLRKLVFLHNQFLDPHAEIILKGKSQLRVLNLAGTFGTRRSGGWLTDRTLHTIAKHCPRLQSLNVSFHRRMQAIYTVLMKCPLRDLDISGLRIPIQALPPMVVESQTLLVCRWMWKETGGLGAYRLVYGTQVDRYIEQAIQATGGRTVFIEYSAGPYLCLDLSSEIRLAQQKSEQTLGRVDRCALNPDLNNEWEWLLEEA